MAQCGASFATNNSLFGIPEMEQWAFEPDVCLIGLFCDFFLPNVFYCAIAAVLSLSLSNVHAALMVSMCANNVNKSRPIHEFRILPYKESGSSDAVLPVSRSRVNNLCAMLE